MLCDLPKERAWFDLAHDDPLLLFDENDYDGTDSNARFG
jgi:hypothetical protein